MVDGYLRSLCSIHPPCTWRPQVELYGAAGKGLYDVHPRSRSPLYFSIYAQGGLTIRCVHMPHYTVCLLQRFPSVFPSFVIDRFPGEDLTFCRIFFMLAMFAAAPGRSWERVYVRPRVLSRSTLCFRRYRSLQDIVIPGDSFIFSKLEVLEIPVPVCDPEICVIGKIPSSSVIRMMYFSDEARSCFSIISHFIVFSRYFITRGYVPCRLLR